ncbi:MAG: hypothetical protein Ct9H300mP21_06610 [Pseudomonadota bacterium]|nr:MAG: hypothetical protein Ct9H300mP21_06610 [Pseudomonadota bacterium]
MIEDRPELIESFCRAGLYVIYPDWHPYKKGDGPLCHPILSLAGISREFAKKNFVEKPKFFYLILPQKLALMSQKFLFILQGICLIIRT